MYTVLIADDEPAALKYLYSIVNNNFPDEFKITFCASNGIEALEWVKLHQVDIIISDIRMPLKDGIALAEDVLKLRPHIKFIIVSGYSDFQYARSALRLGVKDYILKPVVPFDIKEIFKRICPEIDKRIYEEKKNLLHRLCTNAKVSTNEINELFPEDGYHLALLRKNGLPLNEFYKDTKEVFSDTSEKIFIYGRDEFEALYICPCTLINQKEFRAYMQKEMLRNKDEKAYCTLVFLNKIIDGNDFPISVRNMQLKLDSNIVLGKNKIIILKNFSDNTHQEDECLALITFESLCKQQQKEAAKEELTRLLFLWNEQERPLSWIKSMLQRASYLLQRFHLCNPITLENERANLAEIFFYAENIQQLVRDVNELYFSISEIQQKYLKMDSEHYHKIIVNYIESNFNIPLTLQSTCKALGISKSYINKLIRKYDDETFCTYLTRIRIENAKKIIKEERSTLMIKDIAERTGFHDQFYFSRIFRTYTGMSPSEYILSLDAKKTNTSPEDIL